jgi:RHS repeat-associated protein
VTRDGAAFYVQIPVDNSTAGQRRQIEVTAVKNFVGANGEDALATVSRQVFVPRTPETFTSDLDGNLLSDARWTYTWDQQNRLAAMETSSGAVAAGVPREKLEFTYDSQHRRVAKKMSRWNGTVWQVTAHTLFVYDGWNLIAELDAIANHAVQRSYVWGVDLSGDLQGAGGVGGLLAVRTASSAAGSLVTHFAAADGNGNIVALVDSRDGRNSARYEYGPFGEPLRADGPVAEANPFRFSTKFTDAETGLLYYGLRYYVPDTGRWLSRDPLGEQGGVNLYGFVQNAPTTWCDPLGLALYAFDGTNNNAYRDTADSETENGPTNVSILYELYRGNRFYAPGVGTTDGPLNPLGLAGGYGGKARERNALLAAEEFVANGDLVADIIGFSRGAAEARDFANRLKAKFPCVSIRWMGLFDTVASFGLGGNGYDFGYHFGIPEGTGSVLHLTAGGERRYFFPLMSINSGPSQLNPNPNFREQEIVGAAHSDVGGGYRENRGLANLSLLRMWQDGRENRVPFRDIPSMYLRYGGTPHDSRWRNDKIVESLTGQLRGRKIYYSP